MGLLAQFAVFGRFLKKPKKYCFFTKNEIRITSMPQTPQKLAYCIQQLIADTWRIDLVISGVHK